MHIVRSRTRILRVCILYTALVDSNPINKKNILIDVNTLSILLALGMNPNIVYVDNTLLDYAVSRNNVQASARLISYGADLTTCGGRAVRYAAWDGFSEILDLLIQAGADVNLCNEDGVMYHSALYRALQYSTVDIVSKLLTAGALVPDNAVDLAQRSMYHRKEKVELLKTLYNESL